MAFTRRALVIGGFELYWYSVLIALGALLSFCACARRQRQLGLPQDTAIDLVLVTIPCGVIGARAYYVLLNPGAFHSFWDVIDIRSGGLAIYGGLIAGLAAGYIYSLKKHLSILRLTDLALPCVALGQAVGRWGNFLNEEAYGAAISAKALCFFPAAVYIHEDGLWHAATFFYESLWCFLIFLIICVLPTRKRFCKKGAGTLGYVLLYTMERCAVEGLRTDSLYLGSVRFSQLLSAVLLIVCAGVLVRKQGAAAKLLFAASALLLLFGAVGLLGQAVLCLGLVPLGALSAWAFVKWSAPDMEKEENPNA